MRKEKKSDEIKTLKDKKPNKMSSITKVKIAIGTVFIVIVIVSTWAIVKSLNKKHFENTNFKDKNDSFNDPDIVVDENNNIITNPTTPEDKENLMNILTEKLLNHCENSDIKLENIDEIISINKIPYNMDETCNDFDKYLLSIIFKSKNKIFSKDYLVEKEIYENNKIINDYKFDENRTDKENVIKFITYLDSCANDLVYEMNQEQTAILNKLKETDNNLKFVGNCYELISENGEEFFAVPVFGNDEHNNGYVNIFRCSKDEVAGIINSTADASNAFYNLVVNGNDEITFTKYNHNIENNNFNQISEILSQFNKKEKPLILGRATKQLYQEYGLVMQ